MKLLLASSSPRRRELLQAARIEVTVAPPHDVDETPLPGESPRELVCRLAEAKARAVAAQHPDRLVLGADTVVAHRGEVLGKPASLDAAVEGLRRLSGDTHEVLTGVCMTRLEPALSRTWVAVSEVTFRSLSEPEIAAAMQRTNPLDKAGGYAIQEQEDLLVEGFSGLRSTVIGLPVEEVLQQLKAWEIKFEI